MRTDVRRAFRVADGLILVAAVAVGLAASREITPGELTLQRIWTSVNNPPLGVLLPQYFAQVSAELIDVAVIPSLTTLTLACLLLRIRASRPPWRRFSRQPGSMACLIATLAIALTSAVSVTARVTAGQEYNTLSWLGWQIMIGSIQTGVAVFWCWVTMMLSGRWHPEPTWLGRLSRLLGSIWLVVALVFAYANLSKFYL